jgi:hypothetical protein
MLVGFGAFNCVEGLIDHHLLGVHHVNETVFGGGPYLLGHRVPGLARGDADPVWQGRSERAAGDDLMDVLAQYARSTYGVALIWCGFAILAAAATKPLWSKLVFGYEPSLEELLSFRCLGF